MCVYVRVCVCVCMCVCVHVCVCVWCVCVCGGGGGVVEDINTSLQCGSKNYVDGLSVVKRKIQSYNHSNVMLQ